MLGLLLRAHRHRSESQGSVLQGDGDDCVRCKRNAGRDCVAFSSQGPLSLADGLLRSDAGRATFREGTMGEV